MLEILAGFPEEVLAVSATGVVSADDYRKVLEPHVTEAMRRTRPLRVFFHLGPEFERMEPGAMWQDAKLGFSHWRDWGRIAVITDVGWLRDSARLFSPFFPRPVRVFSNGEFAAARTWVVQAEAQAA